MKLILLDVDMTLISTRGAGIASLNAAMHELYGLERGFEGIEFAGRTDWMITEDGLAANGLQATGERVSAVRGAYIRNLARNLSEGWPAAPLPGVTGLLDLLEGRDDACFGLLTGNWKEGAFLKLAACGIDRCFSFGAFAECGRRRGELVPLAVGLAERMAGESFQKNDVWVVGDTPHDVACGIEWGFRTLAVATGPYGEVALEASGAEVVMRDLADTALVGRILLGCGQ